MNKFYYNIRRESLQQEIKKDKEEYFLINNKKHLHHQKVLIIRLMLKELKEINTVHILILIQA